MSDARVERNAACPRVVERFAYDRMLTEMAAAVENLRLQAKAAWFGERDTDASKLSGPG